MRKTKKGERFHLYSNGFPTTHISDDLNHLRKKAEQHERLLGGNYRIKDRALEKWV